jgi:hypothetical protein
VDFADLALRFGHGGCCLLDAVSHVSTGVRKVLTNSLNGNDGP